MNTPINHNKHWKKKPKANKYVYSAGNSVKFGLTKAELTRAALDSRTSIYQLDVQKRHG